MITIVDKEERRRLYRIYLQSDHWKNLRKEKLIEQRYQCQHCGCRQQLQVHHMVYKREFEQSRLWDLKVLCRACHKKVHGISSVRPSLTEYQSIKRKRRETILKRRKRFKKRIADLKRRFDWSF